MSLIDACNKVVDHVNGESYSQSVTAERKYAPQYKPNDLQELRAPVAPASWDSEQIARSGQDRTLAVQLGLLKHVNQNDDAELESLVTLAEEIAESLEGAQVGTYSVEAVSLIPYDADLFYTSGDFRAIITVNLEEIE